MAKFIITAVYEQSVVFEVEAKSKKEAERLIEEDSRNGKEKDWNRGDFIRINESELI